jgi:hypothetical protein
LADAADKALKFKWEHDGLDLAGFRLHYGLVSGTYTDSVNVVYEPDVDPANSWVSKDFRIEAPADAETTYYFMMTAFDPQGNESVPSNEVSALIDFKGPNSIINLTVEVVEAP